MKKNVFLMCLVLMASFFMVSTLVSASLTGNVRDSVVGCSDKQVLEMREAVLVQDLSFDFSGDGVVNLVDVGLFAESCYGVVDSVPVVKKKVSRKSGSSVIVVGEVDGSYSFRTRARAVQYPGNHMIVRRIGEWSGFSCWGYGVNNYCGDFFTSNGFNYANIRVIK